MSGFFIRPIRKIKAYYIIVSGLIADLPSPLKGVEERAKNLQAALREVNELTQGATRDVLFATIGQALSTWSKMEEMVVVVNALLLRVSSQKSGLILYSIINFSVWLSLITDLFEIDEELSHLQKRWNKISERLRKVKDMRDQLAHHSVHPGDQDTGNLSAVLKSSRFDIRQKTKRMRPLTIGEVKDFTNAVANISEDIANLCEAMLAVQRASLQKSAELVRGQPHPLDAQPHQTPIEP